MIHVAQGGDGDNTWNYLMHTENKIKKLKKYSSNYQVKEIHSIVNGLSPIDIECQ